MNDKKLRRFLIVIAVIITSSAVLVSTLLIFSGGIIFSNSVISQQSVVNNAKLYASTNQTAIDEFVDRLDIEPLKELTGSGTEKFTILTNVFLIDSSGKNYTKTIPTNVDLQQASVTDEYGRFLDLSTVQFSFDGVGTSTNKNLEISATAWFCMDTKCDEIKLYRIGTLQNKSIKLYVTDSFAEPPFGDRKYDYTFTFANEGKEWTDGSTHVFRVILKDIIFRNFANEEKWYFVGEDEIYNLKMVVNNQKKVVYDQELQEAISIFKLDIIFSSCAGGASAVIGMYGGTGLPAPVPEIKFKVNGEAYGSIPYHNDGGLLPPVPPGLVSGGLYGSDTCKTLELPRNSEVIATIGEIDYKFFTPKSSAKYFVICKNILQGEGSVYYGGAYRSTSYSSEYRCQSNIGYQ